MRKSTRCQCASSFLVHPTSDYARIKALLNTGRHPTFIGRNLIRRCAMNGGCMIFSAGGQDVACAVVNPAINVLLVLNVHPDHRSHGLGGAILDYLKCNFARVLESAMPFFARNGYQAVGAMHQGKRWKTQVMIKSSLIALAGRVAQIYGG